MQRRRLGTRGLLGLIAGGILLLAASQAQAASSNGPYYAEPAWDQKLAAATRFVVLLDWNSEAVLDRETGLVWEQEPQTTTHVWTSARNECVTRTIGNRKGWRLPSVHELASLVDPSVAPPGPTLPPGHPFTTGATGVQSSTYWSATSLAQFPGNAWDVRFGSGLVFNDSKNDTRHAWCVRGGNNADQY